MRTFYANNIMVTNCIGKCLMVAHIVASGLCIKGMTRAIKHYFFKVVEDIDSLWYEIVLCYVIATLMTTLQHVPTFWRRIWRIRLCIFSVKRCYWFREPRRSCRVTDLSIVKITFQQPITNDAQLLGTSNVVVHIVFHRRINDCTTDLAKRGMT